MKVVTDKRQEVPTVKAVETSLRSVPPEGFEPPTFGSGEQALGIISMILLASVSFWAQVDVSG